MTLDLMTVLAICAMAAATVATRLAGLWVGRLLKLSPNTEEILGAIPPSVLMAVVAPTAFATGWAETIGCVVVAIAATRLSLLPAAACGVGVVAALRSLGL
ncbi:MAG: AzlD domain-containing protein [Alphaproteobacteria bacterium]|uniref:AzlD family protein n=1 Tax=Rhizobium sp. 'Codium 1' TaxID=2940484 RepID=UPI001E2DAF60|nr:AzlD domain-containing protein [Rhizobium sp. 'Codium 1']MBU2329262.1 AzlD domain-containing protein [Alphaproteobacteria bacterium]MCC8933717.1 AzlD domain-containing protein [Rhizobium sp. 'Codium 1']